MLVGDPHCKPEDQTEQERNIIKDYLDLQYAAIKETKPDLVILMGDNAEGKTPEALQKTLLRITKPYSDHNIPFSFVLGNHDLQYCETSSLKYVYEIYASLPGCFLPEDHTEFGDFTLPVFSESSNTQKLQILCMYSGASDYSPKGSYYDFVKPAQIAWMKETQTRLGDIPSVLIQHIPFPEEFGLLKEATPLAMLFDGVLGQNEQKGRFFRLRRSVDGYLGEAPCTPAINSGEFEAVKQCGNIFAAFFGHDHMNDFVGMVDGIILGQCKTASFNAYGDGLRQGVRILDFYENAPYTLKTKMYGYRGLISNHCRSLSGSIAVLHDKTSVKIETGAKIGGIAAAAALPFAAAALIYKHLHRK